MPQVKRILDIMNYNHQKSDNYSLDHYNSEWQKFQKEYAQAKDFVKFLSTLERQFKNLRQDMNMIEETLPSLLTGLKLIWTISRHINQQDQKMESILEAISNEICEKVKSQIDITQILSKMKPQHAIPLIQRGKSVLTKWRQQFYDTKREIENEQTIKRWDFQQTKEIFSVPVYMVHILADLEQISVIIQEYDAILGPELMQVTGRTDLVKEKMEKVKQEVKKIEEFGKDVFNEKNKEAWSNLKENFMT